ncbi:MAG: hypothetical protein Q8K97_17750 [Pseudohongiella sp.]|nr:hypothetical protein [Pseudohongiella sp.]
MSKLTTEEREIRAAASAARQKELAAVLRYGDILTHTRCMDHVEEHFFTGFDGMWCCGEPTQTTLTLQGRKYEGLGADDIAPLSVTHINRIPVSQLLDKELFSLLADHLGRIRPLLVVGFNSWQEILEKMVAESEEFVR